jgi:2',3'-cyclic-nucleotide 2'-phosphodiesterase (5'-nucleotidase family)
VRALLESLLASERPDFHASGLRVEYDPGAAAGQRVRSLLLEDGNPLRDDARYGVVVNDFLAQRGGAWALLLDAPQTNTGIADLDALIEHLRAAPQPVRAPAEDRLRAITRTTGGAR